VETSSSRVLNDGETRLAGWTLLSPEDRDVKLTPKLEEKVLLLVSCFQSSLTADQCSNLRRLLQLPTRKGHGIYARPPHRNHTDRERWVLPNADLTPGAYILSPLQEAGRDRKEVNDRPEPS
jgi:hypothetical protein